MPCREKCRARSSWSWHDSSGKVANRKPFLWFRRRPSRFSKSYRSAVQHQDRQPLANNSGTSNLRIDRTLSHCKGPPTSTQAHLRAFRNSQWR
jgi:hypothetical protein